MLARIRASRIKILLAVLMSLALLGACGGGEDDPATDAGQDSEAESEETPAEETEGGTLEFAGTEYAFSAPPTAPAGATSITLVNNGEERHMLDIVPLTDDAPPVKELIKLPEKKIGKYFTGQPQTIEPIKPGETSDPLELELEPGRYGYVCFFAEKGEKPHALLGMYGELTVE